MDLAKNHLFKALDLKNNFSKADQNLSMLSIIKITLIQNIYHQC